MTTDRAPLDGDHDRAHIPVIERDPAPCGVGDREVDLHVAASAASSNAPQRGDRKIGELFHLPTSSS
jgi:hypothetical protein